MPDTSKHYSNSTDYHESSGGALNECGALVNSIRQLCHMRVVPVDGLDARVAPLTDLHPVEERSFGVIHLLSRIAP
jgi:hypothetical protein